MQTNDQQQPPGDTYRQAQDAFRGGDFDRAISLCREILEAGPGSSPAFDLLAASLHRSGKIEEEIDALKSAADSGGDASALYGRLGELQRVAGDPGGAIATLERAVGIDPENPVTRVSLGRVLYDSDDHAAAEKHFKRALKANPRSAPAHHFLGNIRWISDNWDEAELAFTTALELDADYPPSCLNLAELLFLRDSGEDRAASLERALGLARRAASLSAGSRFSKLLFYGLLLTGKILIELERFEEAREILEEARDLPERHPDYYVALSVTYSRLGDVKKAQEVSRRLTLDFPAGSRLAARAQARVLVLEPLYTTYIEWPYYGPNAYANTNTIAGVPADRLSLHHVYLQGIKRQEIKSYKDRYDVIFNNAANAEFNLRRDYSERVQDVIDLSGLPVVNPPGATDLTTRDNNYARLHGLDHLIFPKTITVNPRADSPTGILERVEQEFEFPVLARRAGGHRASMLEKLDDINAFRDSLARFAKAPYYVIQYHESKHPSGAFRIYRVVFVDGKFLPARMYIDENWLVSGPAQRKLDKTPIEASSALQEEEKLWQADPAGTIGEANMAALHAADDVLKLDCFGMDIGVAADGRVIVFEANACMNCLSIRRHTPKFPYLAQPAEDIKLALEDLLIARARG